MLSTAGVAGYISGVQYKLFGGTNWVRNVLLTATLFCGPLLVVFSFLNTVAIVYRVRCDKTWQTLRCHECGSRETFGTILYLYVTQHFRVQSGVVCYQRCQMQGRGENS